MALKCLILEDELNKSKILEAFLYKIPGIQPLGVCQDLDCLQSNIEDQQPDLVFLDLEHLTTEQTQFLQRLNGQPLLIITSCNKDLAIEGFQLGVVDFILKPIDKHALEHALLRATHLRQVQRTSTPEGVAEANYFFVKSDYKIVKIKLEDIIYIESLGEYVRFHLRKEKIVSLLSMAKLVQVLPSQRFFQIHRSYIINVDHLNFIQNQVVSIGKGQLPVSKARKSEFMKWVESKGLF